MGKWHRIDFKIKWDKKSPAKFFIDLIIIDLLIGPAVKKFKSNLDCWTFHRSADPKHEDGHMLKFNVYATPEIATKMLDDIKSNEDYNRIKHYFEEAEVELKGVGTKLEAISDGNWPIEIQKSWPYYIRGTCEMFMNLIGEIKKKKTNKIDKNDQKQLEEYYKEIKKEIVAKWFKYGSHSFLHHLGAIFGYELIFLEIRAIDKNSRGVIL